jgi:dihydroorotate dehydrogenase electron transfer subunit
LYQEKVPVISNQEILPGIFLLRVDSANLASNARPGQFIMITCDQGYERILRRPLSIFQVDHQHLAILFASVGAGTEWLARRRQGDQLDILGPLGNGYSVSPQSHNLLLVAGGLGIAPLCYLAHQALAQDYRVKLLVGARTAKQICPSSLLPGGCDLLVSTEDGTSGKKGLITDQLPQFAVWADQVYICGPLPMFKAINLDYIQLFANKTVQVSLEVRMGCGMGFCYACTIKTRQGLQQVCQDGPIFNFKDVIWEELK